MTITKHNGTLAGNTLTVFVARYSGVYLYVKYTPGAEAGIKVLPAVKEEGSPVDEFFSIMSAGTKYEIDLVPGNCVYPIPVPELSKDLELTFVADGDDSAAVVEVFTAYDKD